MSEDNGIVIIGKNETKQSVLKQAAESTQLGERATGHTIGGGIKPPYEPSALASLQEFNGTHAICIGKKAQRVAGFGFEIVPHPRADNPSEEELERAEEFWFGRGTKWKIGPSGTSQATPTEVFELAERDYYGIGWDAIELMYGDDNQLQGLSHVPSKSVRKRRNDDPSSDNTAGYGYVQERDAQTVYYGEAADRATGEKFVDKKTGDVSDSLDGIGSPANDLLFIPNPSPLSLWYGIPDWVAEMETMAADRAAKMFNRDFFEYDAIPQMAVIVEGGTLSDDARSELRELVENLRKKDGRGVAVLDAEELADRGVSGIDADSNVNIRIETLSQQGDEDMAFGEFRRMNEHDISKVHEVPPQLIGNMGDSNRSNIEEAVRDFVKEVIEPRQERLAERIYRTIHQEALNIDDWTIAFKTKGADDELRQTEIAAQTVDVVGDALTVNQALGLFGIDPRDDTLGEMLLSEVGGGGSPGDMLDMALDETQQEALNQARAAKRIQTGAVADD